MKYQVMRLICMFDLPMDTSKEKRIYQLFRKALLKEGFVMMQYSVYVRTCPTREYSKRLEKRIETFAPVKGNVRLLTVTEKQYNDMKLIVGSKNATERAIGAERMLIL